MPFKFKLKKSRQYNVSSKNLFVLSVELLDNTTVECTLSAQSLGHECLNNVCQRLNLLQHQYFGLQFLSKKGGYWWVDLQRPLKRQLDKYALDNTNLCLKVMFFVSDVNILHDEVARYHYFLQLKSDILERKLSCNEEQTILFASYSLQAEFGDHDPERHTTEYLTNFGLLPKQVEQGKANQEAILERVISAHRSLQGLSQQLAEVYYIMEAQKLSGYGLECFAAKDNSNNNIVLGVSLMGIYIWHMSNQPSVYFPWDHIINLVHHKRTFGIEHRNSRKVLQNYMDDSHLAKYVWKTCIQQHGFYTKNEGLVNSASDQPPEIRPPTIVPKVVSRKPSATKAENKPFRSIKDSQDSLDDLGVYHTEGRYSERLTAAKSCSHLQLSGSKKELAPTTSVPVQKNSVSSVTLSSVPSQTSVHLPSVSVPQLRRVSSSDVSIHQSRTSIPESTASAAVATTPTLVDSKPVCSVVPTYRQAPDYNTAVKLKYGHGVQSSSTGDMPTSHLFQPGGSQVLPQSYSHYKNFVDLAHMDINTSPANVALIRNQEFVSAPSLHPANHTYSSPDLPSQYPQVVYHYKPPPPYPYKTRSSSSVPDLTVNCNATVSSSPSGAYEPIPITCAKVVTSHPIQHQTIASSQKVNSMSNLPIHSYENTPPTVLMPSPQVSTEVSPAYPEPATPPRPVFSVSVHQPEAPRFQFQEPALVLNAPAQPPPAYPAQQQEQAANGVMNFPIGAGVPSKVLTSQTSPPIYPAVTSTPVGSNPGAGESGKIMGPMLVAAMNGLSMARPGGASVVAQSQETVTTHKDSRIHALESRLEEGQLFLEFEQIPKRKPNSYGTALLPENACRNRFKDVFPYEENRVRLTPTSENRTGYINASHLRVSLGSTERFYIAAQGPLPNTLYSFWQMVWEHHVKVIVMLTEVQEQGRDKCFPYWPQEDEKTLQIGEFQICRLFSMSSPTYVTCSLTLCHVLFGQQRSVWHVQYTDWPDHSCPTDTQGFIAFLSEVDAVRRHASDASQQDPSGPVVIHCSAGVGRSGAVILTDIMLHCLDHNQPIDLPKALTHLRMQRMLTVQTLAQYRFVYHVLIQYLKNSRLI